jgi:hypothetical protein
VTEDFLFSIAVLVFIAFVIGLFHKEKVSTDKARIKQLESDNQRLEGLLEDLVETIKKQNGTTNE